MNQTSLAHINLMRQTIRALIENTSIRTSQTSMCLLNNRLLPAPRSKISMCPKPVSSLFVASSHRPSLVKSKRRYRNDPEMTEKSVDVDDLGRLEAERVLARVGDVQESAVRLARVALHKTRRIDTYPSSSLCSS